MNLEVYDAMGKKVGTDIPSLRKINAETLLDYEVVINGKKVAVATWLKDMVKNGIITESFVVDLYGKDLYESFDDSYDTFDDFDDEFEDDTIVVCTWCGQDFPKEECKLERDMGYLCQFCEEAIKSRGEELIFID
jgi:CRISPR/Cas system-associated protein Cas10 (large subunit of type III CRISPR-Cas system)